MTQMQMPMRKAPVALPMNGVEIVIPIANVLDVKTGASGAGKEQRMDTRGSTSTWHALCKFLHVQSGCCIGNGVSG